MPFAHNRHMVELGFTLRQQLDSNRYEVRISPDRLRRADETYSIPDVAVIPLAMSEHLPDRSNVLAVHDVPLPLVIEVWSPSTVEYDVEANVPSSWRRGDLEI